MIKDFVGTFTAEDFLKSNEQIGKEIRELFERKAREAKVEISKEK